MITQFEREKYRDTLKQYDMLIELLEGHLKKKAVVHDSVALAITKLTDTIDPVQQLKALKNTRGALDAQYDELLRYTAQFRLSAYCEYMFRSEVPAKHHELLIDHMEAVHNGEILRLAISSPPGSAKSSYASIRFATWHLGRRPTDKWLQGAHTQTFAKDRLGKPVRNLIQEVRHKNVFPEHGIATNSAAADYFEFSNGGGEGYYKAVGVGVGISGYRANIAAIDDPLASREDAESKTTRRKLHAWFDDDFGTRPVPGSPIVITACLTGETPVLMADGYYKSIKNVESGDTVVSYGDNYSTTGKVVQSFPQSEDRIYELRTSNNFVRGNERHPFLIHTDAGNIWKSLKDIKKGDKIVSVNYTKPENNIDVITPEFAWVLGFMKGDGWVTINQKTNKKQGKSYRTKSFVTCVADCPAHPERVSRVLNYFEKVYNCKFVYKVKERYYRCEKADLGRDMVRWGMNKGAHGKRIEKEIYLSTDVVRKSYLEGFMAADGYDIKRGKFIVKSTGLCNKNLVQDMRQLAKSLGSKTSNITSRTSIIQAPNSPEPIEATCHAFYYHTSFDLPEEQLSIVRSVKRTNDFEIVYDLTVEGTENFIADGLVCHNTRWHPEDLIGHELEKMQHGEAEHPWTVINIPAIAKEDDVLGREPGEGLWPEVYGTEWYLAKKRGITGRSWNSLYQGEPTDEEGGILKREDVQRYKTLPQDKIRSDGSFVSKVVKRITLSVDLAEKATQRADYSAATVWIETTDKKHYCAHASRIRKEFNDQVKWIEQIAETWNVHQILVEDRGAGTQYIQVRKEEKGFAPVIPISTKQQSKEFRFDGVTPMFAAGEVLLPEVGNDWIADLETELLVFPNGKNDDYVDSVSQYLAYSRSKGPNRRGTLKIRT